MISIRSQKQLDGLFLKWRKKLLSYTYSDFIRLSFLLGAHPSPLLIQICGQEYDKKTLGELQALDIFRKDFLSELTSQIIDVTDAVLIRKGCIFEKEFVQSIHVDVALPVNIAKVPFEDVISILKINDCYKKYITNAIEDGTFPYKSFGHFLQGGGEAKRCLRRLYGIDVNTVAAIDLSIQDLLAKDPLLNCINEKESTETPTLSLRDLCHNVDDVLEQLTAKEQKVLRMRFGVGMNKQYTLEEIGNQFLVTRERIRQIEAKALKKLRHPCRINILKSLCMQLRKEIFEQLMNDEIDVVTNESEKHLIKRVDPRIILAVVISEGSLEKWLNEFFLKVGSGWASLDYSYIELLVAEKKLKKHIREIKHPVPISSLQEYVDLRASKVILALTNIANQFDGYLCKRGAIHERTRRSVRLHKLAQCYFSGQFFEAREILELYNRSFPGSETRLRLIEMDMSKYSHLFVKIYEHLWCSLGHWGAPKAEPLAHTESISESYTKESDMQEGNQDDIEASSITDSLATILRENGPMSFVDVRQAMRNTYGPSFPDGSMVIINIRGEFIRLAPGLYALSNFNIDGEIPVEGLSEYQCRVYAIAKKGGESDGFYPLWTRKYEMELSAWAKTSVDYRLYESLLDIIEPSSWPCSMEIRTEWDLEKANRAHYQLYRDPKPGLVKPDISPVELFSILKYLENHGSISWMTVNRCMGERLDSMCAVWMLGLLASIEAVLVPEHWQLSHPAGPEMQSTMNDLEKELIMSGELSWSKGVPKQILKTLSIVNDPNERAVNQKKVFRLIADNYANTFSPNVGVKVDSSFDEFLEQHLVEKENNEIDILFNTL